MNINDTLMVNINLSDTAEDSTIEVVTYLGQYRDVINIFRGSDAELVYKTLINKHLIDSHIQQLSKIKEDACMVITNTLGVPKAIFDQLPDPNLSDILGTVAINGPMSHQEDLERHCLFSKREDAEDVLLCLQALIDRFDYATLADLKGLIGLVPENNDHMVGWNSLNEFKIFEEIDDQFYINGPTPIMLSEYFDKREDGAWTKPNDAPLYPKEEEEEEDA